MLDFPLLKTPLIRSPDLLLVNLWACRELSAAGICSPFAAPLPQPSQAGTRLPMEMALGRNKNLHLWKLGGFSRACSQRGLSPIAGLIPARVMSVMLLCMGGGRHLAAGGESVSHRPCVGLSFIEGEAPPHPVMSPGPSPPMALPQTCDCIRVPGQSRGNGAGSIPTEGSGIPREVRR